MLAGFIKMPEPIILPIIIDVADQNPIFFAKEVVDDILNEEDKKECPIIPGKRQGNKKTPKFTGFQFHYY